MELQDKYKTGEYSYYKKGFGRVHVTDDPKKFELYKVMGLDVFKKKRKKNVDSSDEE